MATYSAAANIIKANILVVDDMASNRSIICEHLKNLGYFNLHEAANGKEALAAVRSQKIDLIILDIVMPVLDGLSFLKLFREMPQGKDCIVIAQTSDDAFRAPCFEAGSDDYMLKPINFKELELRVKLHLEKRTLLRHLQDDVSRVHKELLLAQHVQLEALPTATSLEQIENDYHLKIASLYEPYQELGGDVWGVVPLVDGNVAFYTADLAGHGLHAALAALQVQTVVKTTDFKATAPGQFLSQLGNVLKRLLSTEKYVAATCTVYNKTSRTLSMAVAGAPAPLVYRGGTLLIEPELSGLPLGIIENAHYAEKHIRVEKDDMALLYSDALIETMNRQGAFFSLDAVHPIITNTALSPIERLRNLDASVLKHSNNQRQDDLTLLAITFL